MPCRLRIKLTFTLFISPFFFNHDQTLQFDRLNTNPACMKLNLSEVYFCLMHGRITHHISIQLLSTDTPKEGEDCCHYKHNGQTTEGNTTPPAERYS